MTIQYSHATLFSTQIKFMNFCQALFRITSSSSVPNIRYGLYDKIFLAYEISQQMA